MRFGRRNKNRPRNGENAAIDLGDSSVGTVASEERSALLATSGAAQPNTMVLKEKEPEPEKKDPTQQLLMALGGFQRQLASVQAGDPQSLWSDESMNYLITAVEVAIGQGWSDLVEASTETGRILQTYESQGRAVECLPFLNDAYEILYLMVRDLIMDNVGPEVREKWHICYQAALDDIQTAGLTLVEDGEDDGGPQGAASAPGAGGTRSESTGGAEIPFELPALDGDGGVQCVENEDLPTLDELPPLDSVLDIGIEPGSNREAEAKETLEANEQPAEEGLELFSSFGDITYLESDAEEDTSEEDTSEEDTSEDAESVFKARPPVPTRVAPIVVDILDRLSDQFGALDKSSEEQRALSMERIEGGIRALRREAAESMHAEATELCDAMAEACRLASQAPATRNENLIDMGFAFCGVYMEAMTEGVSDSTSNWKQECRDLGKTWNQDLDMAGAEAPMASEAEEKTVEGMPEPKGGETGEEAVVERTEPPRAENETVQPDGESVTRRDPAFDLTDDDVVLTDDEAGQIILPALEETRDEAVDEALDGALDKALSRALDEEGSTEVGDGVDGVALEAFAARVAQKDSPVDDVTDSASGDPAGNTTAEMPETPDAESGAVEAAETPVGEDAPAETIKEPEAKDAGRMDEETLSNDLLESAQKASAKGDGASAKYFALQAAASIARLEVARADQLLHETEARLKRGWEAGEQARDAIKNAEETVMQAATEVAARETGLGASKEYSAKVSQNLEDLESGVEAFETQIRELQAKRDAELRKVGNTRAELEAARSKETQTQTDLGQSRKHEEQERLHLETRRQDVKDLHRTSTEMEAAMEKARQTLARQKSSLADIEQTVEQTCGDEGAPENPETMLF